jgi:ribosomal protein L13
MLSKLKVYADSEHPHGSQKPQTLTLTYRKAEA